MMEDPLLQERYVSHLSGLIELTERELDRTRHDPHFHYLAGFYNGLFREARDIFAEQSEGRLSSAFRRFHERGVVELITTTATHALLPLYASQPGTVSAQIVTGLDYFESVLGFRPKGIWLPECGFYPGLDEMLVREGVRFFMTESHGIEHASVAPVYGVHAPLYTPLGVAAFGRDRGSTREVWSAREGFPGDPAYREFYRDIGHDLDFDYLRDYMAGSVRVDTGIKYYRTTGPTAWKEPYHPDVARERAAQHAGDFLRKRVGHVEYLSSVMGTPPIVLAPFDAELFGHWWFEGPQWLDFVIRKAAFDQDVLELTTLSGYLEDHPVQQAGTPCTSTWGHKGYFEAWLNGKTDWIYPQILECGRRMLGLCERYEEERIPALARRALNQCAREIFLAQSSDWPFIINNGTSTEYAVRRVKDHVARFRYLAESLEGNSVDEEYLSVLEEIDNIFPQVDYRIFGQRNDRSGPPR
jgi:1,4-alpha-glucan branching enzyme